MQENIPIYVLVGELEPSQCVRIRIIGKAVDAAPVASAQPKPEKPVIKPKQKPQPPKAAAPVATEKPKQKQSSQSWQDFVANAQAANAKAGRS